MSINTTNQVKKGKLKIFLLFLLSTTFIWFLTKFSKEFTATIEANIQYTSIPQGVLISEDNYKTVSFDVTASGFDFLYYKIKQPNVIIKVSKFYKKGKEVVVIPENEFSKLITSQLNKSIAVRNLSIQNMKIKLDQLENKSVPIRLLADIEFKKGFKAIDSFKLTPNFIDISGPSSLIDSIVEITTSFVKYKNLMDDVSETIKLKLFTTEGIYYSQKEVQLSIIVKEFTQKKLTLPILLKNIPKELDLKIIPETVTVTFDVSMEKFNQITDSDFSIICDYNKRNESENFMIPEFLKKPDSILNVVIQENRIKYLVFK